MDTLPDPPDKLIEDVMKAESATDLLIEMVRMWDDPERVDVPRLILMDKNIIPRARAILGRDRPSLMPDGPPDILPTDMNQALNSSWLLKDPSPPPKPPQDQEAHLMGIALKAVQDALQAEREPPGDTGKSAYWYVKKNEELREVLGDMTGWVEALNRVDMTQDSCLLTSVKRARALLAEGGGP